MLLDKVRSTRQLIEKVKTAEERVNWHQEYQDFYQKLIDQSAEFNQFIESIKSLLNSYPEAFTSPDLSQVLTKIEELLEIFESDPKQNRVSTLSREIHTHNEQWKTKWNHYATEKGQEVIRGLRSIKQVAGSAEDIDTIIHGIERLTIKWPLIESNLTQFSRYLTQAKEKLMNLNTTPEVQRFLDRVSRNEATIGDVTPEVIEWLKENNFSNNLKISFK